MEIKHKKDTDYEAYLWLRKYLNNGPSNSYDVSEAAKKKGFTRSQIKEAKRALGVEVIHVTKTCWMWKLPAKRTLGT